MRLEIRVALICLETWLVLVAFLCLCAQGNMTERRLCPHCRGMIEDCPFCDGGWVDVEDVRPTPNVPLPKPVIPVGKESPTAFRPSMKHIVLGSEPEDLNASAEICRKMSKELSRVREASETSISAYAREAKSALAAIKALARQYKGECLKSAMQKLLDTAHYHMKNSQAMLLPAERNGYHGKTINKQAKPGKAENAKPQVANNQLRDGLVAIGVVGKPLGATNSNSLDLPVPKATVGQIENKQQKKVKKSKRGNKKRGKTDFYAKGKRLPGSVYSKS